MGEEQRNVLAAAIERRQFERHRRESEVEIRTEASIAGSGRERRLAGSHKADVDRQFPVRTDRLDDALLDDP